MNKPQPSAAVFKLTGDIHGWKQVTLRETNFVEGTYLVKVDGVNTNNNKTEQVQILFTEHDAAHLSHTLEIHLMKRESGKKALQLTRDVHAINNPESSYHIPGDVREEMEIYLKSCLDGMMVAISLGGLPKTHKYLKSLPESGQNE